MNWARREHDETVEDWMLRLQISGMAARPGQRRKTWDAATDAEADVLFATFTDAEIRRRQELCRTQMRRAFDARDDTALMNLQRMEDALMRALLSRVPASPGTAYMTQAGGPSGWITFRHEPAREGPFLSPGDPL